MHYDIDYSGMDAAAAEAKAEQDCIKWLGKRQFNKVVGLLQADQQSSKEHMIRLGLAMQGIQGFPAEVMIQKYWK